MDRKTFTLLPYKDGFIEFTELEEGHLYYRDRRLCLKTGFVEPLGIEHLWKHLENQKLAHEPEGHEVFHLFYEAGLVLKGWKSLINSDEPLAVCLNYRNRRFLKTIAEGVPMNLVLEKGVEWSDYQESFYRGMEALKRGDCYQFNLTGAFTYRLESGQAKQPGPREFLGQVWQRRESRGAYAHATYLSTLDMLLISNSPECLFQADTQKEHVRLCSMPIKGTLRVGRPLEELTNSDKNRGELNMITDLVRNDLSSIDQPNSRVVKQAALLKVPGLYHQYSKIEVKVRKDVDLRRVLESLFPGGSVTGAPKKRVLALLRELESDSRGFYCGTTLIRSGHLLAASINIRSGYYWPSMGQLRVHAGGGITLKSEAHEEYEEMLSKVESVLKTLTRGSLGRSKNLEALS